jgi:hypothetical protein
MWSMFCELLFDSASLEGNMELHLDKVGVKVGYKRPNFICQFLGHTRSKFFIRILRGAARTYPGTQLLQPNGTAAIKFQIMHCDRGPKFHMPLVGTYAIQFLYTCPFTESWTLDPVVNSFGSTLMKEI